MRTALLPLALCATCGLTVGCDAESQSVESVRITHDSVIVATSGAASSTPPVAASDGSSTTVEGVLSGRIVFARVADGGGRHFLTMRPDGSEIRDLEPLSNGLPAWSPDGTEGLVVDLDENSGFDLGDGIYATIVDRTGTVLRTLESADATLGLGCGAWSPDAERLVCEGWDDTHPARNGLYTVRASDGGDVRRLTAPADQHHDQSARYSSDGTTILYIHATSDENEEGELWSVDVDGRDAHRLTVATFGWTFPASPDQRSILTYAHGAALILDAYDLDSPPRMIEFPDAWVWGAVWSPDGSHIAVALSVVGTDGQEIATAASDGSDVRIITLNGQEEVVAWVP